jgi:hypothetical protein
MGGTYALVRLAIAEKRQVHATFGSHRRRMCPHVLGSRDGQPRALFFQFAGGSDRGLAPGGDWRCLAVEGLLDVSIHDGPWHTREHSQPQSCIEEVDLEVDP